MTQVGRKPKPTAQKVLQGTFRKDRHGDGGVEYPRTQGAQPPYWLTNHDARDEWDRLVPILEEQLVLTEGDWTNLAHMCVLHGKIVALYKAGEFPTTSQLAELRKLANEFGLTPASRARIPSNKVKKQSNPFAELKKQA